MGRTIARSGAPRDAELLGNTYCAWIEPPIVSLRGHCWGKRAVQDSDWQDWGEEAGKSPTGLRVQGRPVQQRQRQDIFWDVLFWSFVGVV